MRVLHCIPSLSGGGAERQLCLLAEGLQSAGVEIHVAYHHSGPNLAELEGLGATLHLLSCRNNYNPSLVLQIARIVRRVRPDVIQTWLLQMDIAAGIAAMITRTPFILSERASEPAYDVNWKRKLRDLIGRRAQRIVANSELGGQYWCSRVGSQSVSVIPNAVVLDRILKAAAPSPEVAGIDSATEVILCAGRFSPEKNPFVLLVALREVLLQRPKAMALLFGHGPLESEMRQKVRELGIEKRVFIRKHTSELWSWMKRANLFVSVSLFEGSPNAVLEAAVLRCPLVLSDIAGHRELFSEDSATFVPVWSPREIAQAVTTLLDDPRSAKSQSALAFQRTASHSMDAVIPAYMDLYRAALVERN